MMGIGPEEAGRMDLWTYQALLWNWNLAHNPDAARGPSKQDKERLGRLLAAHAAHAVN